MKLQMLAEGIILQSIEDLWNEDLRSESVAFFRSGDFIDCAEMAGMDLKGQVELLGLVKKVLDTERKTSCRGKRPARDMNVQHKERETVSSFG